MICISDTFILDVFENLRKICLKTHHLDTAKILSIPGFACQTALKKTVVKLVIDIDMLSIVEKWIRGGICHVTDSYPKANNKYMKDHDRNKESYLKYWDINKLHCWAMLEKLPKNGFE